jgi:hypothetical protein
MEKEEFNNLIHYYSFPKEQREAILSVKDNLSKITLEEKVDVNLLKQLKIAYDVLYSSELFKDFVNILKDEHKLCQFKKLLYKARLIVEREKCGLPID